jgi:hypothetical protein
MRRAVRPWKRGGGPQAGVEALAERKVGGENAELESRVLLPGQGEGRMGGGVLRQRNGEALLRGPGRG